MEDAISPIKRFLTEFTDGRISPTEDDVQIRCSIVGNYSVKCAEIEHEVIDWALNFLEQRKCPYPLAVTLARKVAQQASSFVPRFVGIGSEDKDFVQEASLLYGETIDLLYQFCNDWKDNPEIVDLIDMSSPRFEASVFAIKNIRRKMEDRHIVLHDLNALFNLKDTPPHSYYAVFDGHAGIDAASYASAHLHKNIVQNQHFLTNPEVAITEAFKLTDSQFKERALRENLKSGCTAVCALISESTLYLSWLGDSQALLVKKGKPVIIMNPHKPDREDERKRIEDLGGCVFHVGTWRVNGTLAVSRALGDFDYKPAVSNDADVCKIPLDGTEDFLVIACDGLWDKMSATDVSVALYRYLVDNPEDYDSISAKLVHQSKLLGSNDNITTIVVFLRDVASLIADAPKFVGIFHQPEPIDSSLRLFNGNTESCKANITACVPTRPTYFHGELGSPLSNEQSDTLQKVPDDVYVKGESPKGMPPEATSISELPTPPIDEVEASEYSTADQLRMFHSQLQFQGLETSVLEDGNACMFGTYLDTSETPEPGMLFGRATDKQAFDLNVDMLANTFSSMYVSSETEKSPDFSQDILDAASGVVQSTIEAAVMQVSSTSDNTGEEKLVSPGFHTEDKIVTPVVVSPVTSPHKLNPYAEPFYMKMDKTTPVFPEAVVPDYVPFHSPNEVPSISSDILVSSASSLPNVSEHFSDTYCGETLTNDSETFANNDVQEQNIHVATDILPSAPTLALINESLTVHSSESHFIGEEISSTPKISTNPFLESSADLNNESSIISSKKLHDELNLHSTISSEKFEKSDVSPNELEQHFAISNAELHLHSQVDLEKPNEPSLVDFGKVDEPSLVDLGKLDEPSLVDLEKLDEPSLVDLEKLDEPSLDIFEKMGDLPMASFGNIEKPSMVSFQKIPPLINNLEAEPLTTDVEKLKEQTLADGEDKLKEHKLTDDAEILKEQTSADATEKGKEQLVADTTEILKEQLVADATEILKEQLVANTIEETLDSMEELVNDLISINRSEKVIECVTDFDKSLSATEKQDGSSMEVQSSSIPSLESKLHFQNEELEAVLPLSCTSEQNIGSSEIHPVLDSVEDASLINTNLAQNSELSVCNTVEEQPGNTLITDYSTKENLPELTTAINVPVESKDFEIKDIQMTSVPVVDNSNEVLVDKLLDSLPNQVSEQVIVKDSLLPKDVQAKLLEVTSTSNRSDSVMEDSQVGNVAVDLQAIPDSIPEAEGVTEDVDSDSEKDGGWSYVKGNNKSSDQKVSDAASLAKKSVAKRVAPALSKDRLPGKSTIDSKSKSKTSNSVNVDHLKKMAPERKTADTKDRKEKTTTMNKQSSLQSSTLKASRVNAEKVTKKVTSLSSVSQPRPSTGLSSQMTVREVSKARSSVLKSQVAPIEKTLGKPAFSSTPFKPEPTKSVPPARVGQPKTTRPSSSAAQRSKDTVSNVSKPSSSSASLKPQVRCTSATLSKPLSSTKSSTLRVNGSVPSLPDAKPKLSVSTLRKPETLASKKQQDTKEAKESANKQISARKVAPSTLHGPKLSTSVIANKTDSTARKPVTSKIDSRTLKSSLRSDTTKSTVASRVASRDAGKGTLSSRSPTASAKLGKTSKVKASNDSVKVAQSVNNSGPKQSPDSLERAVPVSEEKGILEANNRETEDPLIATVGSPAQTNGLELTHKSELITTPDLPSATAASVENEIL